jgi:hypothetical protein
MKSSWLRYALPIGLAAMALGVAHYVYRLNSYEYRRHWFKGLKDTEWVQRLRDPSIPPDDALMVKQVTNGSEPEVITFEVPIMWDELNSPQTGNCGKVNLVINGAQRWPAGRAENGRCLLCWRTEDFAPGDYEIRAKFTFGSSSGGAFVETLGPPSHFILRSQSNAPARLK